MKKRGNCRLMKKTTAVLLALILAAGASACGSKKEEPQPAEQTQEAADQEAQARAEAEAAAKEAAEKEAAEKEAAEKEAAEKEAAAKEAAEKEAAAKEAAEKEKTVKPDAGAETQEAGVITKPDMTGEEPKEDSGKKKKEKSEESDTSKGLELLDGKMTFDGMELAFPIELDNMKLGNWKIEYTNVDDPDSKVLASQEVVTAAMTSETFTADDVTVVAEFGNYSNEEAALADLPMTGIYITKGKGKDGQEPNLPEVLMPGGLTWGSTEAQIRDLFGEASLSGSFFDKDFDFMYENGSYMVEFGGMNDTGIEYIVYCEE